MRSMKWMSMGPGLLLLASVVPMLGCEGPKLDSVCPDSPTIEPQEGNTNGSGGTNGLNAMIFHKLSSDFFFTATTFALSSELAAPKKDVVYPLSQAVQDKFLTATGLEGLDELEEMAARRSILEHAVQCALPEGVLLGDLERIYVGKGLLTSTHGWFNGPLTTPQAEDLFTCLAVLLNPAYKGVPVVLSGPSVGTTVDSSPTVEALWAVEINDGGRLFYHVWPILDAGEYCPADTEIDPWKYRVCGPTTQNCGLDVRPVGAWEQECAQVPYKVGDGPELQDDSHMECTFQGSLPSTVITRPAIRTTLNAPCDVLFLFCPPIPQ